jgi:CDP-glucose 4,6-dehydratase
LIFESFFHSFFSKPGHPVKLATARAGNVIGGGDWAQDRIVADCIRSWKESRPVQIRSPRATRPWQHVLEPLSGYLTLGATIAKGTDIHGASYNFGPRGEQNATVLELLSGLAVTWGYSDPADAFTITNDIPFHEASLLKLNIDKAMAELSWLPTLTYDECVDMTGGWYRDVVKYEGDAGDVTQAHLTRYEQNGIDRNRVWAR